jgi:hypothetical protein
MKTDGFCEICGKEIELKICCSAFDCGCMGQPLEPPICSEKCYDIFICKEYNEKKKTEQQPFYIKL